MYISSFNSPLEDNFLRYGKSEETIALTMSVEISDKVKAVEYIFNVISAKLFLLKLYQYFEILQMKDLIKLRPKKI